MAIYGESITVQYIAWDTVNNAPKTGDASNHTLRWVKDGTAAAPTNSPSEVDATNAPGVYKLTLTASETQCWVGTLCGKSSSSGVVIMPITLTFERLPTAAPGSSGGLPVIGSAPLTNLDAAISSRSTLTAADVWNYATRTLTGFSFTVTVGAYDSGMSPSEQIQALGYTSARASRLDNIDATISSRLAASSYIAPDNASIAAIKSQTDKLSFVGSDVKATLDNEQVTVAVNNDKTGYSLTADYDRAKTALAITEYIAPDNASIAAIKSQTDKLSFVGTDVKATLDGESVIVGSYATNQSPGEQIQGIGYTAERAAKLDNLDASVSTRLAAASYVAPDNTSIAAIKTQTDRLRFDSQNNVYAAVSGIEINAEDVAAAIWDVGMSEHNIPGSAGAKLNVIEARTANITAGTEINVVQPVAQDQTLTLVRGDDYSAADGRALQWTGYFPDLTGATITFTIASRRDYQAIVQATCTAAPGTEGAWTVTAELTSAQTSLLNPYDTSYVYDVEAVIDSRHVTLVRGRVEVLPDANRT